LAAALVQKDAHGRPDYGYAYHYDAAQAGGTLPGAMNLVGKLAWVEWPTGTAHYSFDVNGGEVPEADTLWDPERSPFEAPQRDVFRAEHTFDASGALLQTRLPGGRTVSFSYNGRGLMAGLATTLEGQTRTLVSAVDYDAEENVRRTVNGNGTASCAYYDMR